MVQIIFSILINWVDFSKYNVLNESTLVFADVDGKYMMEIHRVLKPGGYWVPMTFGEKTFYFIY